MDTIRALVFVFFFAASVSGSLVYNFYEASCPAAELIVRNTVTSTSFQDPSIPAKLLRLLFHDCFVEGCDASVMLEGNNTEQSDPANRSVGGFSVIESAKRVLEVYCPGTVSCADIIALAARDAVEIVGGPMIPIPTGRRDGMVSLASNVRSNIVDTSFTMDDMINHFSTKGLSLVDLVILSGGHTIGTAHCSSFRNRFKEESNGKFSLIDNNTLDSTYGDELMRKCSSVANPSVTVNNDPQTSMLFDNQYYKNLLSNKGLFQSDSVLINDDRTSKLVGDLANDQDLFFQNWAQSFLKLTNVGVKTGDEGEVRVSCATSN
ncbi:unnamed protein product [Lupinus luteus]|uniref:Peroxidase n=1 Tax=Lupinus luteus TaxID=3873 RepID=A0AAV1YGX1_LUPLU